MRLRREAGNPRLGPLLGTAVNNARCAADRKAGHEASSCPASRDGGLAGQVPVAVLVQVAILGAFLELVACTRTGSGAHGTAHDRSGRPGDRAANEGAANGTTGTTDAGAGFLITLRGLARDRTTGSPDGTTNSGADRSADEAADDGTADRASGTADSLGGMLAMTLVVVIVVVIVVVMAGDVVVCHGTLERRVGRQIAIAIIHDVVSFT